MKMNRGVSFFVTLFILLILFTMVLYRSNAAGEATGVHHHSSGLIEYLWWNVASSLYGGIEILFILFFLAFVPETKGISLEKIALNFFTGKKLRDIWR